MKYLITCILLTFSIFAQTIHIVTENCSPYNFIVDNTIVGVSTEIIKAVFKEAKIKYKIKMYPWTRAYKKALKEKNVLIYTISKTPKRVGKLKWIGPIIKKELFFYKLKSRKDIIVKSASDLKKYKIGVARNYGTYYYLKENNITNIEIVRDNYQNINKIYKNRIDLLPTTILGLKYKSKQLNYNFNDFIPLYRINLIGDFYMAFSKSTSDKIVKKVDIAFKKLLKQGEIKKIIKNYKF